MMRITTRLAHSRSDVVAAQPRPQNALHRPADTTAFTLLPQNARVLFYNPDAAPYLAWYAPQEKGRGRQVRGEFSAGSPRRHRLAL